MLCFVRFQIMHASNVIIRGISKKFDQFQMFETSHCFGNRITYCFKRKMSMVTNKKEITPRLIQDDIAEITT